MERYLLPMLQTFFEVTLFFVGVTAVANYAPATSITPAANAYGAPYSVPVQSQNQFAPQVVEVDRYGVPEYLPSVNPSVTNQGNVNLPPVQTNQFAPNQQPVGISVPVNQQVGITKQVSVTNPQAISQGYAPPPVVPAASSAYGAPSSNYGSANYLPQQTGQNQPQQFAPANSNWLQNTLPQSVGQTAGSFRNNNGIIDTADNLDTWSNVNSARGVKTQKAKPQKA